MRGQALVAQLKRCSRIHLESAGCSFASSCFPVNTVLHQFVYTVCIDLLIQFVLFIVYLVKPEILFRTVGTD
jgi:hypothetical protein